MTKVDLLYKSVSEVMFKVYITLLQQHKTLILRKGTWPNIFLGRNIWLAWQSFIWRWRIHQPEFTPECVVKGNSWLLSRWGWSLLIPCRSLDVIHPSFIRLSGCFLTRWHSSCFFLVSHSPDLLSGRYLGLLFQWMLLDIESIVKSIHKKIMA